MSKKSGMPNEGGHSGRSSNRDHGHGRGDCKGCVVNGSHPGPHTPSGSKGSSDVGKATPATHGDMGQLGKKG